MNTTSETGNSAAPSDTQNPFFPLLSAWIHTADAAPVPTTPWAPATTWVASWRFCPN